MSIAGMEDETEHNIDALVERLRETIKLNDDGKIKDDSDITQILDMFKDVNKLSFMDNLELGMSDIIPKLLNHESNAVVSKTAEAIVELAKTDRGREICTHSKLIKVLAELLKGDDIEVLTQTTRALANLCYKNEKGIKIIEESDSLTNVLNVLNREESLKDTESSALLRSVSTGFLLNFLEDHSALQQKALEENIVPVICSVLEIDGPSDRLAANRGVLTLLTISESNKQFLDERLCKILVKILASFMASPEFSDLSELCLELIGGQAEDENAKRLLAQAGFCEILVQLIEKYGPRCTDEETRSILKLACDVIILILTGDASMKLLYDGSDGPVYKKLVGWLESKDEALQVTAIAAITNFASTDAHSQLIVSQGIHRKLLQLLREYGCDKLDEDGTDRECGSIRLQHAVLSALRNIVIPACNKPIVLADNLIDVVYPMLNIPTFPVVFKLLGTLRLVMQDQRETAILLGQKDKLVAKTVEWCDMEDHPGVQGEARRLLAWLIFYSRDKAVAANIVKHGGVKPLVEMITVQHPIMQNEALRGLVILSAMSLDELIEPLVAADIGGALRQVLSRTEPQPDTTLTFNANKLIANLLDCNSDALRDNLEKSNFRKE